MGFPERIYYSLDELPALWGVTDVELDQWLMHGMLHAYVWHPLMNAFELVEFEEGVTITQRRSLRHLQAGYKRVLKNDCRIMFGQGWFEMREFDCCSGEKRYCIATEQTGLRVTREETVVLHIEKTRFEKAHEIEARCPPPSSRQFKLRPPNRILSNFRQVSVAGETFHFGVMQAEILKCLHEAAEKGDPWVNGKMLLAKVGSQSFKLGNVFKRHPAWRKLIDSDGRGNYRMQREFLASLPATRD